MAEPRPRYAVATLLTNDSYLPGALTCIHSLLDVEEADKTADHEDRAPFETLCLVTPATVSVEAIKLLKSHFDKVVYCEPIESRSTKELALLGRPELKNTLTKLHLFRQTEYQRILFLDADTLVIRPVAHLFSQVHNTQHRLSAAPDIGWPDAFNSGVMLLSPDQQDFDRLSQMAADRGSWDGGDQGLLNDGFEDDWNRLSFTYNVTPSAYYQYEPAVRRYGHQIKIVHFIGRDKPWTRLHRARAQQVSSDTEDAHSYDRLLHRWFDVYERHFGQQSTASLLTAALGSNKPQAAVDVPKYASSWDKPREEAAGTFRPQDPDQLKAMFSQNNSILAQYASFGYTKDGYEGNTTSGGSQQQQQQPPPPPRAPPPMFPWDATREEANKTQLQMAQPFNQHYENAWDTASQESRQFFKAPSPPRHVPESIRSNYTAVLEQHRPAQSRPPVFPWERDVRPRPTRVFPDSHVNRTQPIESSASSSSSSSSASRTPQAPPASFPPTQARQPHSLAASSNSVPAKALGGLPKDLGYTNAWDSIQGIKKYAKALEGGLPPPRHRQHASIEPEPRRRAGADGRRRTKSEADSDLLAAAEDGDDEDEDTDEGTARVMASMRRLSTPQVQTQPQQQQQSAGSRPHRLGPLRIHSQRSPNSHVLPLPTPDVDVPASMPGNLLTVHKRRISLNDTGSSSASSRTRALRSPLPSPGLSSVTHAKLPNPTAKRVFHPSTDTSIIRKEGEAAYNRYMDILETRGQQQQQQQQQDGSQQPAQAKNAPSSLFPSPPLQPSP